MFETLFTCLDREDTYTHVPILCEFTSMPWTLENEKEVVFL